MSGEIPDRAARQKDLVAEAFTWLSEWVSVVPCLPQSKACHIRWRRFETIKPTSALIRSWFLTGTENLAVVCGSGDLQVLDFDDPTQFEAWSSRAGSLAATYTELTGRGAHVFFRVDKPVSRNFIECEALGLAHLCLVAPSVHPSGAVYQPVDRFAPILRTTTKELFSLLSDPLPKAQKLESRIPAGIAKNAGAAPAGNIGRIAGADVLSKIKARAPLADYISRFTELKPSSMDSRYLMGKCLFHDDVNPSLWVDTQKQIWRCFCPSCKGSKGGDLVNFYALFHSITVNDAIKRLARETL